MESVGVVIIKRIKTDTFGNPKVSVFLEFELGVLHVLILVYANCD